MLIPYYAWAHRAPGEMAVWLALEVLQLDPVATNDPELVSRLTACQELLEERLRAKASANRAGRPGEGDA